MEKLSFKNGNRAEHEKMVGSADAHDGILEDSFVGVIHERILDGFSDALAEAGFTADEEITFNKELSMLSLEDFNGILSLPHELRTMRLSRLHERVAKGQTKIAGEVQRLAKEACERGFTLGYHMSNAEILPKPSGDGSAESWVINGREEDHRDNDLPMAYYSTNLENLYGKKRARFIYVVRAETGPETTHRADNDGSWGRALGLDVVDRFDYEAVMQEARQRARDVRQQQQMEAAQ